MTQSEVEVKLEDDRLVSLWVEACRTRAFLRFDLQNPIVSCLYEAQVELAEATKAAEVECDRLYLALRAHREANHD